VEASSPYSGIGSGPSFSSVDTVTILNGFFDCSSLGSTFCFNGTSLSFQDGSTSAITNLQTVGPSSPSQISGSPSLYFEYLSNSSREGLTGFPILHLGSISFASLTMYNLTVRQEDGDGPRFEREVMFNGSRSRGCAFTVGSVGSYRIFFSSVWRPLRGRLAHDGILLLSASGAYDSYYSADPIYLPTESPAASLTPKPTATGSRTLTLSATPSSSPKLSSSPKPSSIPTAGDPEDRFGWRRFLDRLRLWFWGFLLLRSSGGFIGVTG
jgi:hypothetical protein